MRRGLLPLLICSSIGCQKINYDAVNGVQDRGSGGQAAAGEGAGGGGSSPSGSGSQGLAGAGGAAIDPERPDAGQPDAPPPASAGRPVRCEMVTAQAYKIARDNCGFCHNNAGSLGGAFTFILDLPKLINRPSPTGLSKRLLVPGDPDASLIFFRLDQDQMPPPQRTPRPSRDVDLPVLRDFIANCLVGGPPYPGWPVVNGSGPADAGEGVLGPLGQPGGPCKAANTCDNGGCCVFGLCRGAGQACGMSATGDVVPGMCMNGSCVVDANNRCGRLTEACCAPLGKCTAPGASCGPKTGRCEACGGVGQWCCDFGGFCNDAHLSCIGGGGGGNPATCEPCGAPGQPCCGEGVAADKKCDNGAKCVNIPGVGAGKGDVCPGMAPTDAGPPADAGMPADARGRG